MDRIRQLLLSPDAPGSGGGAPAPSPSASGTSPSAGAPAASGQSGTPSSAAPSSTPTPGRQISEDDFNRYTRYEQQVKAHDRHFSELQKRGLRSHDEALPMIDRLRALESDEKISGIIKALTTQSAPHAPGVPGAGAANEPINPNDQSALVRAEVERIFQAKEQERFQQDHHSAVEYEGRLLTEAVADKALSNFFGDKSFQDVYEGKHSKSGQLVATLLDSQFAALSDRYPDGSIRPLTDPAKAKQAVKNVMDALAELRAMTILDASQESTDIGAAPQGQAPKQEDQANGYQFPTTDKVAERFKQNYEARLARMSGAPQSQVI